MGERIGVYRGILMERAHLGAPSIDGMIILRCAFRKSDVGCERIELAQDRDKSRSLVNVVMNLRVSQNVGNLLTS
jgi:hypothetical protein